MLNTSSKLTVFTFYVMICKFWQLSNNIHNQLLSSVLQNSCSKNLGINQWKQPWPSVFLSHLQVYFKLLFTSKVLLCVCLLRIFTRLFQNIYFAEQCRMAVCKPTNILFLLINYTWIYYSTENATELEIVLYKNFQLLSIFLTAIRSSRPGVFCNKCVYRNFTKFIGNHLCQSIFFNKVQGLACNFNKKRLCHRCFPVNFVKFLRTPFFIGHPYWLLLKFISNIWKVLHVSKHMIYL